MDKHSLRYPYVAEITINGNNLDRPNLSINFNSKGGEPKDIDGLNIMDYGDIEAELNKRKKYEEPEAVFPNFGIIEVSGQSAVIYNPVRWERSMSCE